MLLHQPRIERIPLPRCQFEIYSNGEACDKAATAIWNFGYWDRLHVCEKHDQIIGRKESDS